MLLSVEPTEHYLSLSFIIKFISHDDYDNDLISTWQNFMTISGIAPDLHQSVFSQNILCMLTFIFRPRYHKS